MMSGETWRVNHGGRPLPWFTLLLAAAVIATYALLGPAPESLIFDRSAISSGELWRVLSGHLVHSDREHLIWNTVPFLMLGTLLERELGLSAGDHALLLALGAVVVTAGIWWAVPGLDRYCGLSGVLNTQLSVFLAIAWRRQRNPALIVVSIGVVAKVLVEISLGGGFLSVGAWPSVPIAHAFGLISGVGYFAWIELRHLWRVKISSATENLTLRNAHQQTGRRKTRCLRPIRHP